MGKDGKIGENTSTRNVLHHCSASDLKFTLILLSERGAYYWTTVGTFERVNLDYFQELSTDYEIQIHLKITRLVAWDISEK